MDEAGLEASAGAGAAHDWGTETPGELARDDGDDGVFSKSDSRQDSEQ